MKMRDRYFIPLFFVVLVALGYSQECIAASAPGAPTGVVAATSTPGQATISFTPPVSNGGATITNYVVTASYISSYVAGGLTASGASSPITFTGLTNGLPYYFTVVAVNSAGTSSQSTVSNLVIPRASCPATTKLETEIANEVDNRIAGFSTTTSTFKEQWLLQGSSTSPWQWNTNIWTNNISPIDFTGVSTWNSNGGWNGYAHAGTLISPQHIAYANHFIISIGDSVLFVDRNNATTSRTIVSQAQIGGTDAEVALLNAPLPTTFAYYPIFQNSDYTNYIGNYYSNSGLWPTLPMVYRDIFQAANGINLNFNINILNESNGTLSSPSASSPRYPYYLTPYTGDSGNPVFYIINNQPNLRYTFHFSNSGPDWSTVISSVNSSIGSLDAGAGVATPYRVVTTDLSCFAQPTLTLPGYTFSLAENSSVGTVVGNVTASSNALASDIVLYSIISGNSDSAFSINSTSGQIAVNNPAALVKSKNPTFNLTIKVKDVTLPSLSTTTSATVTLVTNSSNSTAVTNTTWGGTWRQTSSGSHYWQSIASSADGSKLVAADLGASSAATSLLYSVNSGSTWSTIASGGTKKWSYVSMSADGTKFVAAASNDNTDRSVYVGTWNGSSWTVSAKSLSAYTSYPIAIALISGDGTKLVAVDANFGIAYGSSDGGTTWGSLSSPVGSFSNSDLYVSISYDGSKIYRNSSAADSYVGVYNGGTYSSGSSWSWIDQYAMTSVSDEANLIGSAMSPDGTKVAAIGTLNTGIIYTGTLVGPTTTYFIANPNSPTVRDWGAVLKSPNSYAPDLGPILAMSSDGAVIVAADDVYAGIGNPDDGSLWISTDSGATWTSQTGAGYRNWSSVAMSTDGSIIAATDGYSGRAGYIWMSSAAPSVSTQAATSITTSGVAMNGTIDNAGGSYDESVGFVYGRTTAYGATTTSNGTFYKGAFSLSPTGLSCNTTYNYAAYSTNYAGTSYGSNMTFTFPCETYGAGYSGGSGGGGGGIAAYVAPTPFSNNVAVTKPNVTVPVSPKFERTLKLGSNGVDVKRLQIFLNSHGYKIASSGVGSAGHETSYFGPATMKAVIRFQNDNAAKVLTPNGLLRGTGILGPSTMKLINETK